MYASVRLPMILDSIQYRFIVHKTVSLNTPDVSAGIDLKSISITQVPYPFKKYRARIGKQNLISS